MCDTSGNGMLLRGGKPDPGVKVLRMWKFSLGKLFWSLEKEKRFREYIRCRQIWIRGEKRCPFWTLGKKMVSYIKVKQHIKLMDLFSPNRRIVKREELMCWNRTECCKNKMLRPEETRGENKSNSIIIDTLIHSHPVSSEHVDNMVMLYDLLDHKTDRVRLLIHVTSRI